MQTPSPCTNVCTIDAASGWCAGCMRTIDEIAAWGVLDDRQKRSVWKLLPARRAAFALRPSGADESGQGTALGRTVAQ
ncbi:MAG: DUF1289 domain-containing protein [Caldimonas sp.]